MSGAVIYVSFLVIAILLSVIANRPATIAHASSQVPSHTGTTPPSPAARRRVCREDPAGRNPARIITT